MNPIDSQFTLLKSALLSLCLLTTGCATTETVSHCDVALKAPLREAMSIAADRLATGCGSNYQSYVYDLVAIAKDNPGSDNKQAFSDFLVGLSERGIISRRQAKSFYNRYFNIKFISLGGNYNTCSQVCPTRKKVLADMHQELLDKEVGLLQISNDATSYYRADLLLKESELVLEATCHACAVGAAP